MSAIGTRRTRTGYLLAVGLPVATAALLVPLRGSVTLVSDMLLFLLAGVVVALVGGIGPALLGAVLGSLLINFLFTEPLHTLDVRDPNDALALVVFLVVAVLVSSAVDLAARRTREAARAAAETDALAQVDRTRTALLAAVGHDLRSPLAAARASVGTLRSLDLQLDDTDRADLLATAEDSLLQLTELIDDLLDLSRLQAGAMAVVLRPVAVEEVVGRALDSVGPTAAAVAVVGPDDPPPVLVDAGLLERVLANVLANALRYSPADRPPSVVVRPHVDAGHLDVRVVDHGPGIPAEARERVFLPFQRLGDTDNATGIGLGLALSRGLTEAMGGSLEPEDTPGGGLTMRLRLRTAPVEESAAHPGHREREGGQP